MTTQNKIINTGKKETQKIKYKFNKEKHKINEENYIEEQAENSKASANARMQAMICTKGGSDL